MKTGYLKELDEVEKAASTCLHQRTETYFDHMTDETYLVCLDCGNEDNLERLGDPDEISEYDDYHNTH